MSDSPENNYVKEKLHAMGIEVLTEEQLGQEPLDILLLGGIDEETRKGAGAYKIERPNGIPAYAIYFGEYDRALGFDASPIGRDVGKIKEYCDEVIKDFYSA